MDDSFRPGDKHPCEPELQDAAQKIGRRVAWVLGLVIAAAVGAAGGLAILGYRAGGLIGLVVVLSAAGVVAVLGARKLLDY